MIKRLTARIRLAFDRLFCRFRRELLLEWRFPAVVVPANGRYVSPRGGRVGPPSIFPLEGVRSIFFGIRGTPGADTGHPDNELRDLFAHEHGSAPHLHHVVIMRGGVPDAVCNQWQAQRAFGAGDERSPIELRDGYYFPIDHMDAWLTDFHIDNPSNIDWVVKVEIRALTVPCARYDEGRSAVVPVWFDVMNCDQTLAFDVPVWRPGAPIDALRAESGVAPDATFSIANGVLTVGREWPVPISGKVVLALPHVHVGAQSIGLYRQATGDALGFWRVTYPHPYKHVAAFVGQYPYVDLQQGERVYVETTYSLDPQDYNNFDVERRGVMGVVTLAIAPQGGPGPRQTPDPDGPDDDWPTPIWDTGGTG